MHFKVIRRVIWKSPDDPFEIDDLISQVIDHPLAMVTYIPGKWMRAQTHMAKRGYHLIVHDDMRIVSNLIRNWEYQNAMSSTLLKFRFELWRCHVREIQYELPMFIDFDSLDRFINGIPVQSSHLYDMWGCSAIMVKRVKLIERIELDPFHPIYDYYYESSVRPDFRL